jgi:hypothetical protein
MEYTHYKPYNPESRRERKGVQGRIMAPFNSNVDQLLNNRKKYSPAG